MQLKVHLKLLEHEGEGATVTVQGLVATKLLVQMRCSGDRVIDTEHHDDRQHDLDAQQMQEEAALCVYHADAHVSLTASAALAKA